MPDIKSLINLNIEIEGLLRVLSDHYSDEAYILLGQRFKYYSDAMTDYLNIKSDNAISQTVSEENSEEIHFEDTNTDMLVTDIDTELKDISDTDIETATDDSDISLDSDNIQQTNTFSSEDDIDSSDANETILILDNTDESTILDEETECETDAESESDVATPQNLPPVFNPNNFTDTTCSVDTSDSSTEHVYREKIADIADKPKVMRVDEMIQRLESHNLSKAFTLNDRYRYIRELFDNNPEFFDETLGHLSMLDNIDDAYDYLFNDLGWNDEDETVQDFLKVILNHFNL